jgi:hypothetical protein
MAMKKENAELPPPEPGQLSPKEKLYSKVKISVKTLDKIIWLLVVAIVVCVVIGVLRGSGVGR